jgi:hypothetical protein
MANIPVSVLRDNVEGLEGLESACPEVPEVHENRKLARPGGANDQPRSGGQFF